jgi:mono/diheme cytochrome c family protein
VRKLLVVSAALLLASAAALAGEKEDWAAIGMGRALFLGNCVPCHGGLAEGPGESRAGVEGSRLNLARIAERGGGQFDDLRVFQVIYGVHEVPVGGHREMPVWGRVMARQRSRGDGVARTYCASLVSYLKYLQDHPHSKMAEAVE